MSESGNRAKVAVLVLNRDGAHFLDDCFGSLLKISYPPFDVFLIDNNSRDSSVALTRAHYPMITIIENDRNLGFAGAYDRVIRQLDYEYVVLLNNDTVVEEGWLTPLLTVAESNDRVAACGSKIIMMWDKATIDHAGGMLTLIGSGLDRGKWTTDSGQFDISNEVGFGCGCSLLIRTKAYLEVGGFDPDYVIYHEDVDLCWKMLLFGYSVIYVPDSVVLHHVGGGRIQSIENPSKTYLCQKNRLANIVKNMGPRQLFSAIVVSAAYDVLRALRFICLRRWDLLKMLFKGYLDTLMNLEKLITQRRIVQSCRILSDKDIKQFFSPLLPSALSYRKMLKAEASDQ